jgi:hypothetical protein
MQKKELKFSEFVEEYKTWKKSTSENGEAKLDISEVKEIREAYEALVKKGRIVESKKTKADDVDAKFEAAKEKFLNWKKNVKHDDSPLTLKQENKIRAKLGMKLVEEKNTLAAEFKEFVETYKTFKEAHNKSTSLNDDEKKMLKESFMELKKGNKLEESKEPAKEPVKEETKTEVSAEEKRFNEAVEKFKEWKKVNRPDNPEVSDLEKAAIKQDLKKEDITSKLEEAKKLCREARVHIIEGDMMDAGAAVQNAGAAVQAADAGAQNFGAVAGDPAATPLPQNIVDEIAAIKQSVDTLAAEAGIQSPLDLGADPNAGVPATTGVADPNAVADPTQPLPESTDSIEKIKARLEEREAKLEEGKYFVDGTTAEADAVAKNKNLEKQDFHVDKSNPSEELVKIPSTNALLKGTATGPAAKEMKPADQWPTEKIADVSMEKKLGNIEESQETKADENAETKTENLNENKEENKEVDPVTKKVQESLDETGAFNWHNFVKSGNGL